MISRILFLLQSSVWSSLFSGIEKLRFGKEIRKHPEILSPVFIIGHWRTGTTLLHKLFSLDPHLHAPTLFEVAVPDSFLISRNYYRPIFRLLLSEYRPMDMVKIGMDEPQEDEYALYRLIKNSPLEKLVFPKSGSFFLSTNVSFVPEPSEMDLWIKSFRNYFIRLQLRDNRRIVSKNPFNSFRIKILSELYPDARFINLVRHPFDVVPSTVHMWDVVQKQNCLTRFGKKPAAKEVTDVLNKLLLTVEADRTLVSSSNFCEIRFEDLEQDPGTTLKRIYDQFRMPYPSEMDRKMKEFFSDNINFKKNQFTLSEESLEYICRTLDWFMKKHHYPLFRP